MKLGRRILVHWKGQKKLEQLYYAWKTPTDIRDGADAPGICSDHGGAAVALETEAVSSAGCGASGGQQIERALVCPAVPDGLKISPAVIVAITNGTNFLCRATASTTVLTVDMR